MIEAGAKALGKYISETFEVPYEILGITKRMRQKTAKIKAKSQEKGEFGLRRPLILSVPNKSCKTLNTTDIIESEAKTGYIVFIFIIFSTSYF